MRFVGMRTGARLPALGLGTWRMGEEPGRRAAEVAALKLGLDLGVTLIDTAELYADGGAEEIVADAIAGRRDEVTLVSKVLPKNASRSGTIAAAERTLRRLRTDRIDLYLLHWPGDHPLTETLEAFTALRASGKIRAYGLSNFDLAELEGAEALPGGSEVAANQVLYNLERRGIELGLLPWCTGRGIVVMAYSPLEQGKLRVRPALTHVAARHRVTPHAAAIAWTLRAPGVVTIPKATRPEHVRECVAAAKLRLNPADLAELDAAYPAPARAIPLETA
jgi:diketogulonate reductase-like aldo/keto reductase